MAASQPSTLDNDARASSNVEAASFAVEVIESNQDFYALKEHWERLYQLDKSCGFFMSWGWIASVFNHYPGRMRVLAVRKSLDDSKFVALFPVATRIRWSKSGKKFQGILEPGGRTALSEHTGFLCDPDHEDQAISALAQHICTMPWTQFSMRYEPTIYRCKKFLGSIPQAGFSGGFRGYRINGGNTDNLISMQVDLPSSYDEYLDSLSANTRQKIRRHTRRQLESGNWHISQATPETVDRDIDLLIGLWRKQWGVIRRISQARKTGFAFRQMMETAFKLGVLHLPILWRGDEPIVAHGCIADAGTGRVHFVLSGRNLEIDQQNAGLLLHCDSIRHAIEQQYTTYDFGHGDESYKASLGATKNQLSFIEVTRHSDRVVDNIDPFNLTDPALKIRSFIDKENFAKAREACNQFVKILEAHQMVGQPYLIKSDTTET